eukprot:4552570-Prymnesium_polylepis.1
MPALPGARGESFSSAVEARGLMPGSGVLGGRAARPSILAARSIAPLATIGLASAAGTTLL